MKRLNLLLAGLLTVASVNNTKTINFDFNKTYTSTQNNVLHYWGQTKDIGSTGKELSIGTIQGLATVSPFLLPTMLANAFSPQISAGIITGSLPIVTTLLLRANLDSIQNCQLRKVTACAIASSIVLGLGFHKLWKEKSKKIQNNLFVQLINIPSSTLHKMLTILNLTTTKKNTKNKKCWRIGSLVTGILSTGVVYTVAKSAGLNWIYQVPQEIA